MRSVQILSRAWNEKIMKQYILIMLFTSCMLSVCFAEDIESPVVPGKFAEGGIEVMIPSGEIKTYGVLYRPETRSNKLPAIIFVHGWMPYDKNPGMEYSYPAKEFADDGFVTLSVTLRGWEPTGGMDDCGYSQPSDLIEVVKWLSLQEGVDPERIALWGQSLGGQVVLSAAVSERVKATVAYFPITDFRLWGVTTSLEGIKQDYIYGMCAKEGLPEDRSPLVTADRIQGAVLLLHGDQDENVIVTHSKLMHQKMSELNKDVKIRIMKNARHGIGPGWDGHNKIVLEYFKEKLK